MLTAFSELSVRKNIWPYSETATELVNVFEQIVCGGMNIMGLRIFWINNIY